MVTTSSSLSFGALLSWDSKALAFSRISSTSASSFSKVSWPFKGSLYFLGQEKPFFPWSGFKVTQRTDSSLARPFRSHHRFNQKVVFVYFVFDFSGCFSDIHSHYYTTYKSFANALGLRRFITILTLFKERKRKIPTNKGFQLTHYPKKFQFSLLSVEVGLSLSTWNPKTSICYGLRSSRSRWVLFWK